MNPKEDDRFSIGLVTDGKYGERAFNNFKKYFKVQWIQVPDIPPSTILDNGIQLSIPESDLYISYVRHPDIILELAELGKPLILGITPGAGLLKQCIQINPKVVGPRTMCSLEPNTDIPEIDHFARKFGKPLYNTKVNDEGLLLSVEVKRSSPCGSSEAGAKFIKNKKITIENLQNFALSVCHECRAPRFGHTCDKEISGILHILSLFENLPSIYELIPRKEEMNLFIDNINQEFKKRISPE